MPLDLLDVSLFVRVCATRNLSAAGREFSLSPAASSARIAQLERQLGARLLHRTTRQIALTMEGEIFLSRAKQLLEAAELATSSVGHAQANPEGLLRVAASASFGRLHIVPALEPFLKSYPNIRIDLRLSDTIIDLAANGIDVAIRIGELKDSALIAKKLAPNRLVVCASPTYLAEQGTPLHPHDLSRHQCIVLNGRHHWKFENNSTLTTNDIINVRVSGRVSCDSGEVLRDAALNGLGITMHSTWAVGDDIKNGKLVPVLDNFPIADKMSVWAVYMNKNFIPPKAQAFIDFFTARFGDVPYWDVSVD